MKRPYILILIILMVCSACRQQHVPTYVVGFSQCSGGIWREVMQHEMNDELLMHPDLRLHYRCAWDRADMQCAQIDSFIQEKVDILVVAPLETEQLQSALHRAYEAGIPVIIFDRPVPGNEWTAYIGGDNRMVGYTLAQWLRHLQQTMDRPIRVVEFTGMLSTAPAVQRHEGLLMGLRAQDKISLITSLDGQWNREKTEQLCDSLIYAGVRFDAVVAHSDWTALGAADAIEHHGLSIPIIGVDALPGPDNGIEAVQTGRLAASTTYPSRGDLVIRLASQILHGEPYDRITHLQTTLVDSEQAQTISAIHEANQTQYAALRVLRDEVIEMSHRYTMQQMTIALLITLVALLIAIAIGVWRWYIAQRRMEQERMEQEKVILGQQIRLEQMSQQMEDLRASKAIDNTIKESQFLQQLTNQIEILMTDQNLSVDMLARVMGMSRTALFRRVKADIGISPIELISRLRLERAQRLLESEDMTIQQVAYEVGFSSPSYFTRCYRDHFGTTPTDSKNRA